MELQMENGNGIANGKWKMAMESQMATEMVIETEGEMVKSMWWKRQRQMEMASEMTKATDMAMAYGNNTW